YTNEEGTTVTIDATENIINNIDNILNNTEVLNELIEVLGDTYVGGNVYYDGDQFTYVDESGETHTINFEDIVQANETVTTLVDNNDGTYTYTSEDGTVTTVDVPADIVNQFDTIVNSGPVTVDGTTYTSIEEYFETIVTGNSDVLVDNGDGTFTHTAADGTVVTFDANTTAMVDNGDGTYTFTNANGDTITIDSVGDIINNFEDFVTNNEVIVNGDTYNSVEEYLTTLIENNETVTTLVDNGDGTF